MYGLSNFFNRCGRCLETAGLGRDGQTKPVDPEEETEFRETLQHGGSGVWVWLFNDNDIQAS